MPATFEHTLRDVDRVEGWMTDAQARRLWDRATALASPARIVEIGSFRGRSLIVLARAASPGVEVVAIDPHAGGDRGPQEIEADAARGDADHEMFVANLVRAGVLDRVTHIRKTSNDALADVDGGIDLLYIDGAHRFQPALDDIRSWGARVVAPGGTMLIHDAWSSVGVTTALLTSMLASREWTYRGRVGSLAEYVRTPPAGALRNAARQVRELPWFARNVVVKLLILARLGALTRLLGHRGGGWPY